MIYFWADTHFNHQRIIDHTHRPFTSVAEMNEAIIERWNRTVTRYDTAYLLGDFSFPRPKVDGTFVGPHDPAHIFARLNGNKHLVTGNHDDQNKFNLRLPWGSVSHIRVVKQGDVKAILCHYPIESWPSAHHGALHFHGHSHGNLKRVLPHRFDVGFDVWPDGPVSFDRLIEIAAGQTFDPVDHHGEM